jgi:hypothetical protein
MTMDADDFLDLFDLTRAESTRVQDYRRLAALFWLIMLRPGSTSSSRNPPGTARQAQPARPAGRETPTRHPPGKGQVI